MCEIVKKCHPHFSHALFLFWLWHCFSIWRKKLQCGNPVLHQNSNRSLGLRKTQSSTQMTGEQSCVLCVSSGGASASHENKPGSSQPHAHNVMSLSLSRESITALGADSSESQHHSHALRTSGSTGACHLFYRAEAAGDVPCIAKWSKHSHTALLLRQRNLILPNHQKNPWRFASSSVLVRSQQLSGRTWSKIFCELSHLLSLLHVAWEIHHNIPSPVGI